MRAHLITVSAGLLAPHVLVEVLSLFATHVWLPLSRYLWTAHGIATAKLWVDAAGVLDILISAVLGLLIALGVSRVCRSKPVPLWLVFAGAFLISVTAPTLFYHDYNELLWLLARPFISAFLLSAALGFWLPSRRRIARYAA